MAAADRVEKALRHLDRSASDHDQSSLVQFSEFVDVLAARPTAVVRNVFQVFHDMVTTYLGEGVDEYPDDPESVGFVFYDCTRLFVEGSDHPFFADRLFANRLMRHVQAFRRGAQQNKVYIFEGPPGCGKSTFLNNLLRRFQDYANTRDGSRYEVVWRLNSKLLGGNAGSHVIPMLEEILSRGKASPQWSNRLAEMSEDDTVLVPCPSHDNPILLIPKSQRRAFYDDLFNNDQFKWKLFTEKQYEWVFRDSPCTICTSIYQALLDILKSPQKAFEAVFARRYLFNRRLGQGITVFNPGDKPMRETVVTNPKLQERVDNLLRDSSRVRYTYSHYAKTNNGIYALMDIKSHNTERLIELHNIISEGVHKVADIEENVSSLFVALMNPEDKANIENIQSFSDRIEYIKLPYVLDLNTEVAIYRSTFGSHIDAAFLPRVLHNFARVVIATRLKPKSEGMLDWIEDLSDYNRYCDQNLQLLKMEIYTGHIPPWLRDQDRKRFTAKRRRRILAESEHEGTGGLSGRDSLKIFNEFYSTFVREDRLISMAMVKKYFIEMRPNLAALPDGFLDSLISMYNYTVLGEVQASLFYYNEEKISKDIQNYLFAINFEPGATARCTYTGERLEITDEFFSGIERRILGAKASEDRRNEFRATTQRTYASKTLTQEIGLEGQGICDTELYRELRDRYIHSLKDRVLEPFLDNENFRRAIKDFDTDDFKTYDRRIRDDVTFLMENLITKHSYTKLGAKEVCIYVIDNNLAKEFGG